MPRAEKLPLGPWRVGKSGASRGQARPDLVFETEDGRRLHCWRGHKGPDGYFVFYDDAGGELHFRLPPDTTYEAFARTKGWRIVGGKDALRA